ncbi:MAG: TetR/AcrR family transcriptional regulator [Anaerolineaceae bacterium]|nr:TetR/AcrR family transcriptional regulator [Anaerolineaceae bacterium]
MVRKIDRRVQRTRKLLRESMLALIMERGYDEIAIQDVTEKANLGRATFYLHYKEKDDLLADVMQQLFDSFSIQAPQLLESQWRLDDVKPLEKLFEFAESNYDFYRIMIFGKGSITASRQLHQAIAINIQRALESEIEITGAEAILPVAYLANHFAGELLAVIFWWLDNEMPYTPLEMATMYQKVSGINRSQLLKIPEAKNAVAAFIGERIERVRDRGKRSSKEAHTEMVEEGSNGEQKQDDKREERRRNRKTKAIDDQESIPEVLEEEKRD